MDYLKSLWETIHSWAEMGGGNACLPLDQIAKCWGQTMLTSKATQADMEKRDYIDQEFLGLVLSALKNLEGKNLIKFKSAIPQNASSKKIESLEEIINLKSIHDEICLEVNVADQETELSLVKKNIHKVPVDTKSWEDIEIKFKTEDEVEIFSKGQYIKKATNEDLGFFRGKENKKPDMAWHFLLLLSAIQQFRENEATIDKMAYSLGGKLNKTIAKNNCEQIKSSLSEKLKTIFGINNEPFYTYKDYGYYKTKFKLKSLPILRGDGEVYIPPSDDYNDEIDYEHLGKKSYKKAEY